jgi:hypothetical protein
MFAEFTLDTLLCGSPRSNSRPQFNQIEFQAFLFTFLVVLRTEYTRPRSRFHVANECRNTLPQKFGITLPFAVACPSCSVLLSPPFILFSVAHLVYDHFRSPSSNLGRRCSIEYLAVYFSPVGRSFGFVRQN